MSSFPPKLAFVDIETTGTSAIADRIIEIAIIRVENGCVVEEFETLLNPETFISPYIEAITGITQRQVEDAPVFATVIPKVTSILKDCLFIAHNVRFDYSFIKRELARHEISFTAPRFCTVKLSRTLYPNSPRHDLDSVIARHNIQIEKRHRAMDDARAIWQFFTAVKNNLPSEVFDQAISIGLKRPSFPPHLPPEQLENLPEGPGVYIFHGRDQNIPLYVGKSIHLKDRILSHFTQNDLSVDMKICKETTSLEIIQTCGELGALLKEAELIKSLQPIYNRKLRRMQEMVALVKIQNNDGYYTAQPVTIKILEPQDLENILGIFKSRKQTISHARRLTREYQLCPKLMHLETGNGGCLHYQFGWCKGACVGHESPAAYNTRFITAYADTKLSRWPFPGAISIRESYEGHEEVFIFDNWCRADKTQNGDLRATHQFDLDMYKILKRFITKKRNRSYIHSVYLGR
jgi:DNA polymerase-3 subunit epsilon